MAGKEPSANNPIEIPAKVFDDTINHLLGNEKDNSKSDNKNEDDDK